MSKKKFEIVDASEHFDNRQSTPQETNWDICFICQKKSSTPLICPVKNKTTSGFQGYYSVINNLRNFEEIQQLPRSLTELLRTENLTNLLIEREAKFHKACKNRYDDYHFQRASKRRKTEDGDCAAESSKGQLKTRSHFTAENFKPTCLLCDKDD